MQEKPPRAKSTRPRCGAASRQKNGQPCQRFPVRGKTRCRQHGGKSPETNQSARTHGLYSKALTDPQDLESFNRHFEALQAWQGRARADRPALHGQRRDQGRGAPTSIDYTNDSGGASTITGSLVCTSGCDTFVDAVPDPTTSNGFFALCDSNPVNQVNARQVVRVDGLGHCTQVVDGKSFGERSSLARIALAR
jgi:hypothetical protein